MSLLQLRKKSPAAQIRETHSRNNEIVKREKEGVDPDLLIPTGSTLLNCACSDTPFGGYRKGKIVNMIGDSSSGKSLLSLTCLAEMAMYERFDNYRFIYDDVEAGVDFNLDYLFGEEVAPRIETDIISDSIQDFYKNILIAVRESNPFIYILDSLDALSSIEEQERAKKMIDKDQDQLDKTMGMEKAKMLTQILRNIKSQIKYMDALLIIISQVRDNTGYGFSTKTRAGGKALKHYSSHEIWLTHKQPIERKNRIIGHHSEAKVSKNRITGKVRLVPITMYDDHGIDDIGVNVDFLVDEKHWSKAKMTIVAEEFGLSGVKENIVKWIEEQSLELELQKLVGKVWNEIEEACRLNRKSKYLKRDRR